MPVTTRTLNSAAQLRQVLDGHLPPEQINLLIEVTDTQWRTLRHGDQLRWDAALTESVALLSAPEAEQTTGYSISDGVVQIGQSLSLDESSMDTLTNLLRQFIPWRKGPWQLAGITIDTEWRSDWKWDRLAPHVSSLRGRRVLDVGCGNGYHLWRIHDAGAARTVGIDPGLLFNYQFNVLHHLSNVDSVLLLPLTLEQLPSSLHSFDTVFSMGVLSHRRDPLSHLKALKETLAPGGELVLETLVVEQNNRDSQMPAQPSISSDSLSGPLKIDGRYARMRNVWQLPDTGLLASWLDSCGFADITCVSEVPTTVREQRTTDWMPFESLADSLDPTDDSLTIEGYPAPRRAIVIAKNGN